MSSIKSIDLCWWCNKKLSESFSYVTGRLGERHRVHGICKNNAENFHIVFSANVNDRVPQQIDGPLSGSIESLSE